MLALFNDVETITNPDGTNSPSSTHTVHYAVWSQGNIVAEVAVSHTADQSDTTGTSYANGIITNRAILLSELLAGEQPAAPTVAPTQTATSMPTATARQPATPSPTATLTQTATPTATATRTPAAAPTRTATPTATATSQPEPTTGPMSFSVPSVKLAYGSAKPKNALHHASLTKVRQGQTVKLLLYVEYRGIEGRIPVRASFRVLRAGHTAFFVSSNGTAAATDNGGATAYWTTFRPKELGAYTFNATIFVGTKHKHKSAAFNVTHS